MVEYTLNLDYIFSSLADPTRRDILRRLRSQELSVGEIAKSYSLTFAAVSKHLKVLERARLIVKNRRGKEQIVHLEANTLKNIDDYLKIYRRLWENRFDALDNYLKESKE